MEATVMPANGQILSTVERLYSAAIDAKEWPSFLAKVTSLLAADNAYVSTIEHDQRYLGYVVLDSTNWGRVPVERYTELMNDDPRIATFRGNTGQALHCGTAVSRQVLHASRIYAEALKPLGIEHTLLVGLPGSDSTTTHYVGLTRGLSRDPFDAADCMLLNEFVPHLSRAFTIRNHVSDAHRQHSVLRSVVARLPYPAFLATRSGTVRFLNEAAHALSVAGLGLRIDGGRLQVETDLEHDQLLRALAAGAQTMVSQKIILKPFDTRASLIVTVDPSMPTQIDPLAKNGGGGLMVVSVETVRRQGSSEEDRIRGAFGLSPAQSRLTLLLRSGRSVKEAAAALGITEGSARQYVKIVFRKTGAKRQAELVRIIDDALSGC